MSWYSFIPKLFNMSLTASVVICIVLVLRLILKKVPKVVSYALWSVVLFRLLCPISIESDFSFFNLLDTPTKDSGTVSSVIEYIPENIVHTEYPSVNMPIPGISNVINEALPQGQEQLVADPLEAPTSFATYIWMIGILVMVIYSIVSYIRLHQTLLSSVKLHDNIFLADSISSPFVMGLIRPKIYLPSSLSEKERDYIILHEQHHIRRGDHVVKLLSFIALCLHWFNPLVWVAFIQSGKDMEMSCDEAVLRKLGEEIRVDYSASLISLATGRRIIAGAPLAFGEGDTEGRIKNIAKWKKPAVWVIVVAVIVCVVLAVCLITNPMNRATMLLGAEYRIAETLYNTGDNDYTDNDQPSVCITADYGLWEWHGDETGKWRLIGQLEPYALTKKELSEYTAYDEGWRRRYNVGEITDAYILRDDEETASMFFLAFTTKSGDTLLGYGIEDVSERGQGASDDTSLYWLCRLESVFDESHTVGEYHERSLAQTVGSDVEIFNAYYDFKQHPEFLIVGFKACNSPYADGIQLPSPEITDMGFAVFYQNKEESGYRLLQCHVYENAALAENGIYLCPDPAVLDLGGEMKPKTTYDVILLNNDTIKKVTRIWEYADGKTETESQGYLNGHEMVLFSWENDKPGSRVWQYFYDEHDELIDYSSIVKNETAPNIRVWVDYFRTPDKMDWDIVNQTNAPDYPGVTFTYTSEKITAEDASGTTELVFGMPIWNAFFSDLNGDGLAEICATVSYGSGMIDTHVVVYDYKRHTQYTLWERGVTDYALRALNGQLVCDKWAYPDGEVTESGYLAIENGELVWISGVVDMTPTTANITGAFDGYLYVPIDGATYRYERIYDDPSSITKGKLIHSFTEGADPSDVEWRVYAVDDYPDRSVVLAEAGDDYVHLYRYSPSKAVDPALLEQAKEDGKIVLEDGYAASGQALWNTFYKLAGEGKHISADIVHYHTLREPGQYDQKYYEAHKEDYPSLYEFELTYDDGTYTMKWKEYGMEYERQFKYLRKFEDVLPTQQSFKEPQKVTRYVLTNNNTASWDELWRSLTSSQLGDFIDHYTIYSEKN